MCVCLDPRGLVASMPGAHLQVHVDGSGDGAGAWVLLFDAMAQEGQRGVCTGDTHSFAHAHAGAVVPHVHGGFDHKLALEARGGLQVGRVQLGPHQLGHEATRGGHVVDVGNVEHIRVLWGGKLVGTVSRRRRQSSGSA